MSRSDKPLPLSMIKFRPMRIKIPLGRVCVSCDSVVIYYLQLCSKSFSFPYEPTVRIGGQEKICLGDLSYQDGRNEPAEFIVYS